MDKITRMTPPAPQAVLARILNEPELVAAVQTLPPAVLGKLINHIGLEDAGELVALATTSQLQQIFDEDLFRQSKPGCDEEFDADRFALWLMVMLEAGEDFTAEKLTELPEDLVTLALLRHILVISTEELAVQMAQRGTDEDLLEKALESSLSQEFAEHLVIAKKEEGWDAILSVLLALDKNHSDFLSRLLDRLSYLSRKDIDDSGGLYHLLTEEESLTADVVAEREDRRAESGYIAPSAAASLLRLIRQTELSELAAQNADPITSAYFRNLKKTPLYAQGSSVPANDTKMESKSAARTFELLSLLQESEILEEVRSPARLGGKVPDRPEFSLSDLPFAVTLRSLFDSAPEVFAQRMSELAYLTNVLVAGCSFAGRSFRSFTAASAVLAACNLGFEHLKSGNIAGPKKGARAGKPMEMLRQRSAVDLFRLGFHLAYREVSLATLGTLRDLLAEQVRSAVDRELASQFAKARNALDSALAARTPWSARRKLDILSRLFAAPIQTALLGLLDECPHLAGALRIGAASATEIETPSFVATAADIDRVQRFLHGLTMARS